MFSSRALAGIVCALAMIGCGDSGGDAGMDARAPADARPDVMMDATPDANDVCACQGAGALAQRITHRRFDSDGNTVTGVGAACAYPELMMDYGKLLGGGGALRPESTEDEAVLTELGVELAEVPLLGEQELHWWATLQADGSNPNRMMDITVACVDTSPIPGSARQFAVSHELAYASLPPDGVVDASARCTRGVLVGGGCSSESAGGPRARLLSAGMSPTDEKAWLCSWRNRFQTEEVEVVAQAFCLEETIVEECECPPSSDAVTVKRETLPLGPGRNQVEASCATGELLLLGGCTLDAADSASLASVSMVASSFPPGEEDTWRCTWNNPDAVVAMAMATALCIAE